jgi:thioredoxin 2
MAPRLDEVSATLGDVVRVVKLNAESEQDLARQLGVKALPTLIFFKGGHEVRRSTGSKTAREVIDMVTKSGD